MLEKDFAFFKEHLADFLKDHRGEYGVIKKRASNWLLQNAG